MATVTTLAKDSEIPTREQFEDLDTAWQLVRNSVKLAWAINLLSGSPTNGEDAAMKALEEIDFAAPGEITITNMQGREMLVKVEED